MPLTKQILVQENDYVKAGTRLSDGGVSPTDILNILGPVKAQDYIVNEVQAVYRLQGVKINDKHFEIIVRQMMRKVQIDRSGDTEFLNEELVDKWDFMDANDRIFGKYFVIDAADSQRYIQGDIIDARDMRNENSSLEKAGQEDDGCPRRRILPPRSSCFRVSPGRPSGPTASSPRHHSRRQPRFSARRPSEPVSNHLERSRGECHLRSSHSGTGQKEFQDIIVGRKDEYEQEMSEL